jgi:hypothetical protein
MCDSESKKWCFLVKVPNCDTNKNVTRTRVIYKEGLLY